MRSYLVLIAKFFRISLVEAFIFLDDEQRDCLALEADLWKSTITAKPTQLAITKETP